MTAANGAKLKALSAIPAYSRFYGDAAKDQAHRDKVRELFAGRRLAEGAQAPLGNSGLTSANPPDEPRKRAKTLRFDIPMVQRVLELRTRRSGEKHAQWSAHNASGWESAARGGIRVLESQELSISKLGQVRTAAWNLRQAARPVHPNAQTCHCGWTALGDVGIVERAQTHGGGFALASVSTCGSVHDCPVCAMGIKGGRAEQIREGVRLHCLHYGRDSLTLNTYTIRHKAGHSLSEIADGFQRAWYRFKNRVPPSIIAARRARKNENLSRRARGLEALPQVASLWERVSAIGGVYGQEVTSGRNGWHLHRHEVMASRRTLSIDELTEWQSEARLWWAECVEREMGSEFVPTDRGFHSDPLHRTDYIAKLGLEIADIGKDAKRQNQNQWQLLRNAAKGHAPSLEKFAEYSEQMRGRKCIQFSDTLRDLWVSFGMLGAEQSDIETLEDGNGALVAEVPRDAWRVLRRDARLSSIMAASSKDELYSGLQSILVEIDSHGWGNGARIDFERDEHAKRRERAAIMAADGVNFQEPRSAVWRRNLRSWLATMTASAGNQLYRGTLLEPGSFRDVGI